MGFTYLPIQHPTRFALIRHPSPAARRVYDGCKIKKGEQMVGSKAKADEYLVPRSGSEV